MSLGVFMKAFNAVFFKSKLDFYTEFVPQIILLLALFGYMDAQIIVKWLTDFTGREQAAPSIITNMIDMALHGGGVQPDQAIIGTSSSQQAVNILMLLVALITIPWMLLPKPFILSRGHEKKHSEREDIERKSYQLVEQEAQEEQRRSPE